MKLLRSQILSKEYLQDIAEDYYDLITDKLSVDMQCNCDVSKISYKEQQIFIKQIKRFARKFYKSQIKEVNYNK